MAKKTEAMKPLTKSEIVSGIAESTGLSKKDVNAVFSAMASQMQKSLGKRGCIPCRV
jgi:nucleoid DNA-binding protein